mgnify:FL=1
MLIVKKTENFIMILQRGGKHESINLLYFHDLIRSRTYDAISESVTGLLILI